MATPEGTGGVRKVRKAKTPISTIGVVRLVPFEEGVLLPEALDAASPVSRQLAVEVGRCMPHLGGIAMPDEGLVLVAEADQEGGFRLDDLGGLLIRFSEDPTALGESGMHVGSASLFPWGALRAGDELLKLSELAERAVGLRRQMLTRLPEPTDAPEVAPEPDPESARRQALDQLRDAFERAEGLAQRDARFAAQAAELVEGALGRFRGRAAEAHPLADKELPAGAGLNEPLMSARETIERLKGLRDREAIQAFLDRFVVGKAWATLEDNQYFVNGLNDHLRPLKLRVACVKDGQPSLMRCYPTTKAPRGAFYFDHSSKGNRDRHGGATTVGELRVVAETPDARRKSERPAPIKP